MLKVYYANIAPLEDDAHRRVSMDLVQPMRREKLSKLKSKEECMRGLAASRLLCMALEAEGIFYENQIFSYGEHGKPYILHKNMHFNMSHAGNYAVCAISDQKIGVDVEAITRLDGRLDQTLRIAKRILTQSEFMKWKESGAKSLELLKIWTRKESYAKMTGLGLSIGLENIDTIAGAHFQNMQPDDVHYVSVCTAKACEPMQVFERTNEL